MVKKEAKPLSPRIVGEIKGMIARGDPQMQIAVWFGLNQARISEVNKASGAGRKYKGVAALPESDLPPRGPYAVTSVVSVYALAEVVRRLELMTEEYRTLLKEMTRGIETEKATNS
jgi:hypothetical protein